MSSGCKLEYKKQKDLGTNNAVKIINFTLGIKESYSRVNESKQQLNSFIIYNLDSIVRVNDKFLGNFFKK